MRSKVLAWCRAQSLIPAGSLVFCAVSGGADSVAMLHCLLTLREALCCRIAAAHFNHGLRGAEADRDEAFVRELCGGWGVPLTLGRGDALARACLTGESVEQAARALRYEFFSTLPGLVATAHTADDDLETILMNLLRGTSLKGLCGIPPARGQLVRPILCATRADVARYLEENGLRHVEDSTNADDGCLRNRLRHHVLPLLTAENPSLPETALRSALLLREDEAYLAEQAGSALARARLKTGWSCRSLASEPDAVRTRAVRSILSQIHAPKLSEAHIQAVDRLIVSGGPSERRSLPGFWTARREYDLLTFSPAAPGACFRPVSLDPDGVTEIPELRLLVRCASASSPDAFRQSASCFACRPASGPLVARPRAPGDVMRFPGGSRTLKKLMIDLKLPAARRGLLPVIADSEGVLGVYGIGVNPARRAAAGEPAILIQIDEKEEK